MSDQYDMFGNNSRRPTEAYARSGDPDTAKNAARKISYTKSEQKVYEVLKETGTRMTSLCIMRYLQARGEQVWSVSPRLVPLWRKGLIEKAGTMTVIGSNGKPSTLQAWRIRKDTNETASNDPTPVNPVEAISVAS